MPYGSFNLATFGGQVVTSSLLTGQVTELGQERSIGSGRGKVAPETRYVAISLWPGLADLEVAANRPPIPAGRSGALCGR